MTTKRRRSLIALLLLFCTAFYSKPKAQTAAPPPPSLAPTQAYSTFHPFEVIRFSWSAVPQAATYVLEASSDPNFSPGRTIRIDNIPQPFYQFAIGNPEGSYQARVFAVDASGVSSAASNVISFSVFFNNPIGPAPTLASPANGAALTLPITVTWNHVPNPQPSGYELQVARDANFSSIEDDSPQLNGPSRTILSLTPGTKFWRVRSFQGDASPTTAAATAWSEVRSFTIPNTPPRPVSITVTKDPLFPGESAMVQVQLSSAVGASGATIAMTSSNQSIAPVPATVSMPANTAWLQFMMNVSQAVTQTTPVTLTAALNGAVTSQTFTVQPAALQSLQISPGVLAGGNWTVVWVNLAGAAPAGGAVVGLTSDNPAVVPPGSITVPAGSFSNSAWVQTNAVTTSTTATVTGTYKGATAQTTVTLQPQRQPTSVTLNPSSTTNGSIGTMNVAASAGYDEFFALTSSNPAVASVPASVAVSAGMTSVNFQITTGTVNAPTAVTISATGGGVTRSATLTVNPNGATAPLLSSFTVSPTSVSGGTSATGTVRLSSAAPAGGTVVSLGSNLPGSASVPPSVTVSAGATSATFPITTFAGSGTTTVQLNASVSSAFLFASLTVTAASTPPPPPPPPSGSATLTVSATGRSGQRVTSNPAGINVTVGSSGSATLPTGSVTLTVSGGRSAVWSGACSSGGSKRSSCTFTLSGNASVQANVQ